MRQRLAFLVPLLAGCVPVRAVAQEGRPVSAVRTGTLGRTPLVESSGVAVSHRHPGVLWSHNDSDDGPYLYALTLRGELLATYRINGAASVDWEDLALGPCPAGRWRDRSCLYVADTGDNLERRPYVVVYVVPEPAPLQGRVGAARATEPALSLRVRFRDGPHDVEALAVDPAGTAHLVTKGRNGPILRYVIPSDSFALGSATLAPVDTLPIAPRTLLGRWATGAAVSPSGRRVVVRTHTDLYFFRPEGGRWVLDGPPCRVAGLEPQGEAVDFRDEEEVVLTSERGWALEGVIHLVRCR